MKGYSFGRAEYSAAMALDAFFEMNGGLGLPSAKEITGSSTNRERSRRFSLFPREM